MTNFELTPALLSQFAAALNSALNPTSSVVSGDGLGFVAIPDDNSKIQYLFPNYDRVGAGQKPYWITPGAGQGQYNVPPTEALRGQLKFVNLVDTNRGGQEKQKCEFWFDCGTTTYVLELGWANESGKINNASKSFLKSLSALSPQELREPLTFALTRLIDKPNFTKRDDGSQFLHKVLVTDVWRSDGSKIYDESGDIDVVIGEEIIRKINFELIEKSVVNPREKKAAKQQTPVSPTFSGVVVPQQAPAPSPINYQAATPIYPDSPQRLQLTQNMDNHVNTYLGGNMEVLKQLVPAMFPGKIKRPHLNDLELQQLWNELQRRYPVPAPQPVALPTLVPGTQPVVLPQYNPDEAVGF